jgi:PBP1b-binding outer membrane lipoprotein LpoB
MRLLYWLTAGLILSSAACWAADNEAYIDQLGDYATIYVEQDGSGNRLIGQRGPVMETNPAQMHGDGNYVDIRQVGSGNLLKFSINSKFDGDTVTRRENLKCTETNCGQLDTGNTFIYYVYGYGSKSSIDVNADGKEETAAVTLYVLEEGDFNSTSLSITGLRNSAIVLMNGDSNIYAGLIGNKDNIQYATITGSQNNISGTQSGTMGIIHYVVSGNLNIASVKQEGGAALGHYARVEISGNTNSVAVEQKGLSADNILDLKTTGSNNNFNIKSNSK